MAKGLQPYWLQAYLLLYIPVGLFADSRITAVWQQYLLGALTFLALYLAALKAPKEQWMQVWVCVAVATGFEIFSSLIWGIYAYRLHNVPLFAAIFIIVSELEIVGTSLGNWYWLPTAPWTGIPSGNPPSVIAAGYCIIDGTVLLLFSIYRWGLNTIRTRITTTITPRPGPKRRPIADNLAYSGEAVAPSSTSLI